MDAQSAQPLSTPPKKLLIVEDDFYIRDVYKLAAKNKGYVVYTASDGEEALSLSKIAHPDVILLDIMLPKVSGIDVLKTIKSWEGFEKVPIIMVTNVGESETYQQAIQAGAADYILKVQQTPVQIVEGLARFFNPTTPHVQTPMPVTLPPFDTIPPIPPVTTTQLPNVMPMVTDSNTNPALPAVSPSMPALVASDPTAPAPQAPVAPVASPISVSGAPLPPAAGSPPQPPER